MATPCELGSLHTSSRESNDTCMYFLEHSSHIIHTSRSPQGRNTSGSCEHPILFMLSPRCHVEELLWHCIPHLCLHPNTLLLLVRPDCRRPKQGLGLQLRRRGRDARRSGRAGPVRIVLSVSALHGAPARISHSNLISVHTAARP